MDIIRFFAVDEIEEEFRKIMKTNFPEYKIGLYFTDNSKINEEEFNMADFIWADEKTNQINITKELVGTPMGENFLDGQGLEMMGQLAVDGVMMVNQYQVTSLVDSIILLI